ncbi:MAG: type II CAAX endopeptidase family protein [Kofleriaceae bacterium]
MSSPTSQPRTSHLYHAGSREAFPALAAIGLTFASVATMFVLIVIATMVRLDLTIAVAIGQVGLVAVPVIAMAATGRDRRVLGLARPRLRFVVAAMLVGASAWFVNMAIVSQLPFDTSDTRSLRVLLDEPSLWLVLACIAVAPAVCEEILFRGVLMRGLGSRLHAWVAVIASALMFSLYHMNPIQMIPTLVLGLLFGAIATRGGSAIPTMLAHALNNAIALLVARGDLPGLIAKDHSGLLDRYPIVAVVVAGGATAGGLALALTGSGHDE